MAARRALPLVLAAAALVGFAYPIIVGYSHDVCPPHFCDKVSCEEAPKACEHGALRPNASFCGCCPGCIKYIKSGESCFNIQRLNSIFECAPGTKCVNNTCTANKKKN